MSRKMSENGLKFTAAFEAFRSKAYRATPDEKSLTIGYGHYGADVKPGQIVTQEEALALLSRDMGATVTIVDRAANNVLSQGHFDAVCDLVYNVGAKSVGAATGLGMALRAGDVVTLRAKLALFINQNGKPLLGLRRRTAGRLALFDGLGWQEAEKIGRSVI